MKRITYPCEDCGRTGVLCIIWRIGVFHCPSCGCNKAEAGTYRLRTLETGASYTIYVDNLTGIQYLKVYQGGICIMVDAEGKPLIWEGEK